MLQTTNYKLNKLELTDSPADITALNPNFDTIDAELKNRRLSTVNVSNPNLNTLLADKTYSCAGTITNTPIPCTFCILNVYDTGEEVNGVIVQLCHVPQTNSTVRSFIRSVNNGSVFGAWSEITTGAEFDYLQTQINDNTFRYNALAGAMSKDLTSLFVENFMNTNDVNLTLGDSTYVVNNYYDANKRLFNKDETGSKTLYSVAKTVTTGNNTAWCLVDWENVDGGAVAVAISRDNGATFTTVNTNGNITTMTSSTGVNMVVKITLSGKLRLKNIAWGVK